ncbi:hypothetical protein MKK63_09470 [Methylobacterium sp. J-088]|uniref:hypothetical protein n=1 Tax=Methylobacterium sp. J-088 TaxID=2836664 RepID=UPI001FB9988A|nr:hypothetical protein [Methylobacterium sp. J-088]MCJ2062938.1 hypothetical protein [Methylobacterium sp. J-088]
MSLSEHQAEGAALASIELHRTFISALVLSGVMSKEQALALIDAVLQRVERMQMGAAQQGPAILVEQAKAARFYIETVAGELAKLDVPKK